MSINVTTSSVGTSSSTQTTNTTSSKNSSTESFKEEFDKVSSKDEKNDIQKIEEDKNTKNSEKIEKNNASKDNKIEEDKNTLLEGEVLAEDVASKNMINMNDLLANDIKQMANNRSVSSIYGLSEMNVNPINIGSVRFDTNNSISMNKSDAEFFINLTKNDNISAQNIVAQAQNMINNGAEVTQVKQNVQISETLLNAINKAKETNQPLRIDFDKNVTVILKISQKGSIAANFIPGDKAVEQYLRNNIENLRATFRENDLPYTDLSYSNRGSKQQKENRKNKQ